MEIPNIRLSKTLIAKLRSVGLLDEIALRNYYIKREFIRRSKRVKLKKKKMIIRDLANQLAMDPRSVHTIVYQKLDRKTPLIIKIDKL